MLIFQYFVFVKKRSYVIYVRYVGWRGFGITKNPNRIRIWDLRLAFGSAESVVSFLNLSPFTQPKWVLIDMKWTSVPTRTFLPAPLLSLYRSKIELTVCDYRSSVNIRNTDFCQNAAYSCLYCLAIIDAKFPRLDR